jgi:uncharacterized CHY-type Zn-finger protein
MIKTKKMSKNSDMIICRFCHKEIITSGLVGLSPVCPYCKKPLNGQFNP